MISNRLYFSYSLLAFSLLFAFLLPEAKTKKIREKVCCSFSPLHRSIATVQAGFSFPLRKGENFSEKLEKLSLENLLLTKQLEKVKEYLLSEDRLDRQVKKYEEIGMDPLLTKEFVQRREKEFLDRISLEAFQVPAEVVYRDPAFWSSYVWINIGQKDNRKYGEEIISVDSPVVLGNHLVGVVDHVGETVSRVCLITSSTLTTAVRVIRGSTQNKLLMDDLALMIEKLKFSEDVFFSEEEQKNTLHILGDLLENIKESVGERFLAKGELRGSSQPLWRAKNELLNGIGFNYDFADEEGPARDLRTGKSPKGDAEFLIKEGDLLVTTGMDGIFPEGLYTAIVTKVEPLEEGSISYSLKAKATSGDLSELTNVYVLKKRKS